MNRPLAALASLATALVLLGACGEQRSVTMPGPAAAPRTAKLASTETCRAADLTALSDRIGAYVAKSAQSTASGLLRDVQQACRQLPADPNTATALKYTAQLLAWWRPTAPATKLWLGSDAQLWDYLTLLFKYIGHTIGNDVEALGTQGFIGVCTAGAGCDLIAKERTSGIRIYPGALSATPTAQFLVTGSPAACTELDNATDLQVWGQCIEVTVDPKDGPGFAFQKVTPGPALVQTCFNQTAFDAVGFYLYGSDANPVSIELPDATTTRTRLAQRSGGKSTVSLRAHPANGTDVEDGFFLANCDGATDLTELSAPARTKAEYAMRLFGRAGSAALRIFTPQPLYAAHGGLGSLGFVEEMSLFGPADPFTFQATFDNPYALAPGVRTPDVPGQAPVDDDLGRAEWSIAFQDPGYVLVRAAPFGGFAAGTKVVEINQGGGASSSKQGMEMLANLAFFEGATGGEGTPANTGKYRIRWTSSIASPRAGGTGAPFVALGVDSHNNPVTLARFAYVNGPNAQSGLVTFNDLPVAGLTWQQNVPRRYELIIDLIAGKSYLRTVVPTGSAQSQSTAAVVQSFPLNSRLLQAGWKLGKQDNQVIGMDDLEIVRLADTFDPTK